MEDEEGGEFGVGVRSSHALDLLADVYVEVGELERARRVLVALAGRWDVVRRGYWEFRVGLLGGLEGEGVREREGEAEGGNVRTVVVDKAAAVGSGD